MFGHLSMTTSVEEISGGGAQPGSWETLLKSYKFVVSGTSKTAVLDMMSRACRPAAGIAKLVVAQPLLLKGRRTIIVLSKGF